MKRLIFGITAFAFTLNLTAQQLFPDGSFEQWQSFSQGSVIYEEPASGWWGTLNKLSYILQGNPVTVSKTADSYTGQYSIKLETKSSAGVMTIPGLLYAGYFDTNSPGTNYIVQGRPFSQSLGKIRGFYKYTSVNGDSAGIYAVLTRYNNQAKRRDTIAQAVFVAKSSVYSYQPFEAAFTYTNGIQNPDTLFLLAISSLGWNNFSNAQVGSTFYLDQLGYETTTGIFSTFETDNTPLKYLPEILQLEVSTKQKSSLIILAADGKTVYRREFAPNEIRFVDLSSLPQGFYVARLIGENSKVSVLKFINH